ncbi:conserved hypothetical protein [Rhodobacteraceae bacterium KLH11]|nr:conserved hypothetical protein [Rhodobacteraceae bacterium KLH11]
MIPKLDDTDFDALVEEARGLIPEYAPEWTDHNLHDPGITVIDLLAWLVDQQIYRIGHVGPSLRRAFSRLMGIEPRPARQAIFDVWSNQPGSTVLDLAAGQEAHSIDLPDAQFMVAEDVRLTGARIETITLVTEAGRKPLGDGLAHGRSTLSLPPTDGGGPLALEIKLDQVLLQGEPPVSLGVMVERPVSAENWRSNAPIPLAGDEDMFSPPADQPRWDSVIVEQRRAGDDGWIALPVTDRSFGLTRSGTIRFIPVETGSATVRLRLSESFRPGTVTLRRIGIDVVTLAEGWRDIEEVIGFGNDLPDQSYEFPTTNIAGGLERVVLESPELWSIVEDFTTSAPDDRHVTIDHSGGLLRLGNGVNGRVLETGEQLRHKPLIRTSGVNGNVAQGLRWTVSGRPIGENLAAGTGGRDADRLQDLIARARAAASTRIASMSEESLYELISKSGLGIARFEVLAGYRPGGRVKGARTVLIIPDRAADTPPGRPRAEVIESVENLLEPSRLMGERIFVSMPIYRNIDVSLVIAVKPDADVDALRAKLKGLLHARFWDLPVREDVAPWPPGRDISVGDLRALAGRFKDVLYLKSAIIRSGETQIADDADLFVLGPRELPLLRTLSIVLEQESTP